MLNLIAVTAQAFAAGLISQTAASNISLCDIQDCNLKSNASFKSVEEYAPADVELSAENTVKISSSTTSSNISDFQLVLSL